MFAYHCVYTPAFARAVLEHVARPLTAITILPASTRGLGNLHTAVHAGPTGVADALPRLSAPAQQYTFTCLCRCCHNAQCHKTLFGRPMGAMGYATSLSVLMSLSATGDASSHGTSLSATGDATSVSATRDATSLCATGDATVSYCILQGIKTVHNHSV
jgi:hypothetical protein